MRQIARRAGVGPATLYRRFPTRQELVNEAFLREFRSCRAIVDEAVADPDPWRGLCTVIERITALNAQNQGFTEAFLSAYPGAVDLAAHRSEMLQKVGALTRRAQTAGALRPDFVIDDFLIVLMGGRGLAAIPAAARDGAARRYAALAIDAFRAPDPGLLHADESGY